MPMYIKCANTRCDNPVSRIGELCNACQPKPQVQQQDDKVSRWSIWNRHKGDEHNKHRKADE